MQARIDTGRDTGPGADGPGLVGYGHSWVYGSGAADGSGGFAARAARDLGLRLDNRAESGTLSTDTATLVAAEPPAPAAAYLIMTGFNDARRYGDDPAAAAAYADALATVLDACRAAAPAARMIMIEQPYIEDYSGHAPFDRGSDAVVDRYNRILREVAGRQPETEVVPVAGWRPRTMIAADGVHPNDHGHRRLAETVVDTVSTERVRS
ncbi:GDSL-type esterase/lipase family protein [Microlunatus speluncae]|uniref:GDSL-type esterase/lipase family protein n=1 Tax=Microlunatus speluncae TaxID=2594267 RepID=UPI0012665A03|nr:GDSL-type esterase/lipase family protein [Microlunatus speluncae]